jgi:organic radical activating enzyme
LIIKKKDGGNMDIQEPVCSNINNNLTINLKEIFSSIQGEGVYCGIPQLFIRLAGCNLDCAYCDTKSSKESNGIFRVEEIPGSGKFEEYPNPADVETLLGIIKGFSRHFHQSIAFTGGEPLLQTDFLKEILPVLVEDDHRIYLETNGTLPEKLEELIKYIDIIAMDIKLPSMAKLPGFWDVHREFLKIASDKDVFVKIVVSEDAEPAEIAEACKIVSDISDIIPLVIQPVTDPCGKITFDQVKLNKIKDYASKIVVDVRVIPQVHKFLKVL